MSIKIIQKCAFEAFGVSAFLYAIMFVTESYKKGFFANYVSTSFILGMALFFGILYGLIGNHSSESRPQFFIGAFVCALGLGLLAYQYGALFGSLRIFFALGIFFMSGIGLVTLKYSLNNKYHEHDK